MTDHVVLVDCRGLPAALAVLRVKQTLSAFESCPQIKLIIDENCNREALASALEAETCCLAFVKPDDA